MAHTRKVIIFGAFVLVAMIIVSLIKASRSSLPKETESANNPQSLGTVESKTPATPVVALVRDDSVHAAPAHLAKKADSTTPLIVRPPQQLVAELLEISSANGPITAEKAE